MIEVVEDPSAASEQTMRSAAISLVMDSKPFRPMAQMVWAPSLVSERSMPEMLRMTFRPVFPVRPSGSSLTCESVLWQALSNKQKANNLIKISYGIVMVDLETFLARSLAVMIHVPFVKGPFGHPKEFVDSFRQLVAFGSKFRSVTLSMPWLTSMLG